MTTALPSAALDLPLTTTDVNAFHVGTATLSPLPETSIQPDEVFGHALNCSSQTDTSNVRVQNPGWENWKTAAGFELWLKIDALPTGTACVLAGTDSLISLDSHGQLTVSLPTTQPVTVPKLNLASRVGQWIHLAASFTSPGTLALFLDGAPAGTASVTSGNTLKLTGTTLCAGRTAANADLLDGWIAHLRLYETALTPAQIQASIVADLDLPNAATSPRISTSFPFAFELNTKDDPDHEPNVLKAGSEQQSLQLQIVNTSGSDVTIQQGAGTASPTNYHFAVRFRPGTLHTDCLSSIQLSSAAVGQHTPKTLSVSSFSLHSQTDASTLEDSCYVLWTGAAVKLERLISLNLQFDAVVIDTRAGTRGTNVTLDYGQNQLITMNHLPVTGSRENHVTVAGRQVDSSEAPLIAEFVEGWDIIRNSKSSETTLSLRIQTKIPEPPGSPDFYLQPSPNYDEPLRDAPVTMDPQLGYYLQISDLHEIDGIPPIPAHTGHATVSFWCRTPNEFMVTTFLAGYDNLDPWKICCGDNFGFENSSRSILVRKPPANQWTHYAFVFELHSESIFVYVNGEKHTITASGVRDLKDICSLIPTDKIKFARLAVYNRALPASAILTEYNQIAQRLQSAGAGAKSRLLLHSMDNHIASTAQATVTPDNFVSVNVDSSPDTQLLADITTDADNMRNAAVTVKMTVKNTDATPRTAHFRLDCQNIPDPNLVDFSLLIPVKIGPLMVGSAGNVAVGNTDTSLPNGQTMLHVTGDFNSANSIGVFVDGQKNHGAMVGLSSNDSSWTLGLADIQKDFTIHSGESPKAVGAERLRIDPNGNVGISTELTPPPTWKTDTGSGNETSVFLAIGDGDTGLYHETDDHLAMCTRGRRRLQISPGGQVSLASDAPPTGQNALEMWLPEGQPVSGTGGKITATKSSTTIKGTDIDFTTCLRAGDLVELFGDSSDYPEVSVVVKSLPNKTEFEACSAAQATLTVPADDHKKALVRHPALTVSNTGRLSDTTGVVAPVGMIAPFAGKTAPSGWLLCDGRTITETDYPALVWVLKEAGNPYHPGTGACHLPDLRGRVPVGLATMSNGSGAPATSKDIKDAPKLQTLGETGGAVTHKLKDHELAPHGHNGTAYTSNQHSSFNNGNVPLGSNTNQGAGSWTSAIVTQVSGLCSTDDQNTQLDQTAVNMMQPFTILNYIIKT